MLQLKLDEATLLDALTLIPSSAWSVGPVPAKGGAVVPAPPLADPPADAPPKAKSKAAAALTADDTPTPYSTSHLSATG